MQEHPNSTLSDTLRFISDDKSLALFNMIALSPALTKAGLTKRTNREYYITSFGKIVYEVQVLIGNAKQSLWKFNSIDSIESLCLSLTVEERRKIIDSLMVDDNLKDILNKYNARKKEIFQPLIDLHQKIHPKCSQPVII